MQSVIMPGVHCYVFNILGGLHDILSISCRPSALALRYTCVKSLSQIKDNSHSTAYC